MSAVGSDLEDVLVGEREVWQEGPPNELFAQLRRECPVHWTERMTEFPEQAGFWSVTTAEDVHAVRPVTLEFCIWVFVVAPAH